MRKIICLMLIFVMAFTMMTMVACKPEKEDEPEERGTFYSLQEAYDQGLITQDDLESIANYYKSENQEELDEEIANAIKETRAYCLRTLSSSSIKNAKADDVTILGYYGTYNNCFAVKIDDDFAVYTTALREVTLAGIVFRYSNGNSIII